MKNLSLFKFLQKRRPPQLAAERLVDLETIIECGLALSGLTRRRETYALSKAGGY